MKITDLAALVDGIVEGDHDVDVTGVNGIERAQPGDVTFATDDERLARANASGASCVLAPQSARASSKTLVRVRNPQLAFLLSYRALQVAEERPAFIHPTAIIAGSVALGEHVWVGPHVVIEDGGIIGHHVIIEANTVVKKDCRIGARCRLYPNVTLYDGVELGEGVVLHSGVVVGSDGFGFIRDRGQVYKFPQIGKVIIEDYVEIGANTTIDRGSLNDTVIGAGSKIDNLCQVAHNVRIGRNALVAAQCGFSGSTVIGNNITMGGQSGVVDNVSIGDDVTIGSKTAVTHRLRSGSVVWGIPARPAGQAKRQAAVVAWLARNFRRVSKGTK